MKDTLDRVMKATQASLGKHGYETVRHSWVDVCKLNYHSQAQLATTV
jgi:hypothetical protein